MKYSDKYPPPDDGGASLGGTTKIVGLHPLVWVCIAVMVVVGFMGFDHLKGARWNFEASPNGEASSPHSSTPRH